MTALIPRRSATDTWPEAVRSCAPAATVAGVHVARDHVDAELAADGVDADVAGGAFDVDVTR